MAVVNGISMSGNLDRLSLTRRTIAWYLPPFLMGEMEVTLKAQERVCVKEMAQERGGGGKESGDSLGKGGGRHFYPDPILRPIRYLKKD